MRQTGWRSNDREDAESRTYPGRYTRAEDGVTFDYSVTVARADGGTVWFSRVTCNAAPNHREKSTARKPQVSVEPRTEGRWAVQTDGEARRLVARWERTTR